MTRDKFKKIGDICCAFQHHMLTELVSEPDKDDAAGSTHNVYKFSKHFSDIAYSIEILLEELEASVKLSEMDYLDEKATTAK